MELYSYLLMTSGGGCCQRQRAFLLGARVPLPEVAMSLEVRCVSQGQVVLTLLAVPMWEG